MDLKDGVLKDGYTPLLGGDPPTPSINGSSSGGGGDTTTVDHHSVSIGGGGGGGGGSGSGLDSDRDAALKQLSDREKYEVASFWFKDAVHFRPSSGKLAHSSDARAAHRLLHRKLWRSIRKAILITHLLMAFIECPTSVPGVPPLVLPFFELFACCGLYIAEVSWHYRVMGRTAFLKDKWLLAKLVAIPLTVIDSLIGLSIYNSCSNILHYRPLRALRVYYVIENSRQLRSTFAFFIGGLPKIMAMYSVVLILIIAYAALAMFLFIPVPGESRTFFPNL